MGGDGSAQAAGLARRPEDRLPGAAPPAALTAERPQRRTRMATPMGSPALGAQRTPAGSPLLTQPDHQTATTAPVWAWRGHEAPAPAPLPPEQRSLFSELRVFTGRCPQTPAPLPHFTDEKTEALGVRLGWRTQGMGHRGPRLSLTPRPTSAHRSPARPSPHTTPPPRGHTHSRAQVSLHCPAPRGEPPASRQLFPENRGADTAQGHRPQPPARTPARGRAAVLWGGGRQGLVSSKPGVGGDDPAHSTSGPHGAGRDRA